MLSEKQAEEAFQINPGLFHYPNRELNEEEVEKVIDKLASYKQDGKTLADDFLRHTGMEPDEANFIAKNIDKIRRKIWRDYLGANREFSLFYFNERNIPEIRKQFSEEKQVYVDLVLYLNRWMKNLMSNPIIKSSTMLEKFGNYATEDQIRI